MSVRCTLSRKFYKNRVQNSLVPEAKILRRKNKSSSFGNLIGQNSHVPVLSTTSTRFEFVACKNKSFVWSRSRNMDTYVYSTLAETTSSLALSPFHWLALSLTGFSHTLPDFLGFQTTEDTCKFSQISSDTDGLVRTSDSKAQQNGPQKYIHSMLTNFRLIPFLMDVNACYYKHTQMSSQHSLLLTTF